MTSSPLRATLKLRSFPPHGVVDAQRRTLARLYRLVDVGTLSAIDVDVWGSHAVTDSMTHHDDAASLETVSEFERWAEERGYTLAPAFACRECGSMIDEARWEVTVVPLLTLVVYEENRLKAVYPHDDGERVRTVEDGLETLETMRRPTDGRSGGPPNERGGTESGRKRLPVAPVP